MSNANVEVRIIRSRKDYAARDTSDQSRVVDVIRTQVLPKSEAEYYRVDVKVRRGVDQAPKYLLAYLLRKDIYLAEIVKIDVDKNFQVTNTTWQYDDAGEPEDEPEGEFVLRADEYAVYDIVAATPVPDIATAKKAVENIYTVATAAGLRCKVLMGPEANVANYKTYLTCGLKGFINVGHGNTSGIVLSDGVLSAAWFNTITNQAVKPAVVYFNSCQVHNDPLKSAVMAAGTRTFIGGIVNLLIGASEDVCVAFWTRAVSTATGMADILHQCEKEKYPAEGSHGISGDLGPAMLISTTLDSAAWVHGNSMAIEFPERLELQKPMGFYMQVKGKPFTSNWFHFAVPTPVITSGQRMRVGSVMIRFRTGPGACVNSVHIYDGETLLIAHDNLKLTSPNAFSWPRFDVPVHPPIHWGLGVSIGVGFGDSANLPANKLLMDFSAVGCDFGFKVFDASEFERTVEAIKEKELLEEKEEVLV